MLLHGPAAMPVTTPDAELTEALPQLLLQVPPGVALLNTIVLPTHTWLLPVIGEGLGFTVKLVVTKQPPGSMYVITVTPADTPVTTPDVATTVAIPGLLLLHKPPVVASVNNTDIPTHPEHPDVGHAIGNGIGFTVTAALPIIVAVQPKALTATTVYTQGAVCSPKLIGRPVPGTDGPTGVSPQNNW